MTSLQMLVGAMISVFLISMFADHTVARRLALLDAETRERIWKRETQTEMWWRIPQYIGIVLMVFGVLRNLGMLKIPGLGVTQAIAMGLAIFCAASILRSWLSKSAVGAAAPGTPASKSALMAALLITVAELALAGVVGWMVFKREINAWMKGSKPAPAVSENSDGKTGAEPDGKAPGEPAQLLWVDEAEALRMLKGKSAAYLKALAKRGDVRSETNAGKAKYRRDDISQMKIAGLPTEEELAAETKDEAPKGGEKIEP